MFWVNKLNILSGLNLKVSEKRMFSCLPIASKMMETSFILSPLPSNPITASFMLLLGSKILCSYSDLNRLEKGNPLKYFLANKFRFESCI